MALRDDQQQHIRDWQVSGLLQAANCRGHGLNVKTHENWLRAYRRGRNAIESPALIPVAVKPAAVSAEVLLLRCRGTHVLELPMKVSPCWLGELSCLD